MLPFQDKSILGILSIVLLIAATCASYGLSAKVDTTSAFYFNLYSSIISIFNLVIIFGWMAAGKFGGISLMIISFLTSFLIILKTNLYECSIFTLPFFAAAFMGHTCARRADKDYQSYVLKSEKLEEELNIISNNIGKSRAFIKSLESKLNRYSTLKEVTEALSTDLSLDDINSLIIDRAASTIGKEGRLLLFMVDVKKQELILAVSWSGNKVKNKKGDIFDYWVLRHRKPLIIEDITEDFRFSASDIDEAKESFRSLIATPLVAENKVIGIMRMDSPTKAVYTQDDLRIFDIIADLGAVAVENAMLYSRTQELAIKDGLTGLVVRRYFMDRFKEELNRAARTKGEIALLILDIDRFKEYNDRYGHTAGDLVLRHLSRTVSSMVREGDIVARFGGEEIAVLLFGVGKAKAAVEAEAIRRRAEEAPLTLRRHKARTTVSIGVSSYPDDASLEEELIKIADERLYNAKKHGRNRVCSS